MTVAPAATKPRGWSFRSTRFRLLLSKFAAYARTPSAPSFLFNVFESALLPLVPLQKGRRKSQEEAAGWLSLFGTRAKSAQDRADKARVDASLWLRDAGGTALSLEGRDQATRLECAAWLRLAGGRAKSAQARAEDARSGAVSWLTETGGRAVSQQEKAAGVRSDAAAWLATRGASELERTTSPAEGRAAAARTEEIRASLDDGKRVGEYDSLSAENEGNDQTKEDEILSAKGPSTHGGSQPRSPVVRGSPRTDRLSSATVTEEVRAGEADECTVQGPPRKDEEVGLYLAGDDDVATVASSTGSPPLPCESVSSTENRVDGTADATAIAATAAAATAATTATASPAADADATGDFEHPVGRTASTDRTAPAPWLDPATTPLARGGSFAPTAAGAEDFGRMLDVGETEWSRVSLSRTPPFDALNSPSLPQRYAPVRARPRPLPPRSTSEGFDAGAPFAAVNGAGVVAAGAASNPNGSEWMEFFAPPNQMAPKGDAYRGSDSFRSADASASTTVRADSAGSFIGPEHCANGSNRAWRFSGGGAASEESWGTGLSEAHSPAGEAQSRIMSRASGEGGGGRWEETSEPLSWSSRSPRAKGEGSSRKRWHKQAEQSRQYMQRWEAFLGRAHRHFDGEVSQVVWAEECWCFCTFK